jgi:hypothetical protein
MWKIILVGAGELGSRHLQGILKFKERLTIYVFDPSEGSLKKAEERANEISHTHKIVYSQSYDVAPHDIDLCIIATNSDVRHEILEMILSRFSISNMILEKVLFQKIEHYVHIHTLLKEHGVNCWVNHPLRLYPAFQKLKNSLINNDNAITNQVYGQNWGLGCNSLHWIDLIEFLTEERLTSIDTTLLTDVAASSKREGFIEFKGTILAKFSKGTTLQLTDPPSLENDTTLKETISIMTPQRRVIFQKAKDLIEISLDLTKNTEPQIEYHKNLLQSQLTTLVLEEILIEKKCQLPLYEFASNTHQIFISSLIDHTNKTSANKTDICRIT